MGIRRSTIAGFEATCAAVSVGADTLHLWHVADLERHVDRRALLAADDAPDPPYWAHLWSGALLLAAAVPPGARTAIELGCGLGLPGLAAARRGARVVLLDRVTAALVFARASAAANGLAAVELVAGDATAPPVRGRYDLVLAAELLYDRAAFVPLARALAALVAPGGRVLLADAGRIDTAAFYPALEAAGFAWRASVHRVREEGLPLDVRLVEATALPALGTRG
jgi:predicted nicotinamide N-methyase